MKAQHAKLADLHLEAYSHHAALSDHHAEKGDKTAARLHHGLAGHHMKMAEQHHAIAEGYEGSPADERADAAGAKAAGVSKEKFEGSAADRKEDAAGEARMAASKGEKDPMAVGAATQLHKKGHIDAVTRDRIHADAGGKSPGKASEKPKRRPFGALSGAGHYMGDVDTANSAGTNAGGV